MHHEELQEVVAYIQRQDLRLWPVILQKGLRQQSHTRSLSERRDDALQIQAALQERLGCPVTEVQVELLWEHFSAEQMLSRWGMVDDGMLALCARWIVQEVYPAARKQACGLCRHL
jgi:hypothetical protein